MALIKCPECGKEISSLAPSCPNCGYPMDTRTVYATPEDAKPMDGEIPSANTPRAASGKKKGVILAVVGVIFACVVGLGAYRHYNVIRQERIAESERLAQIERSKELNEFSEKMHLFGYLANIGAEDSNRILDKVLHIWRNSIYKKESDSTDNYTKDESGIFYDDFNIALYMYYSSAYYEATERGLKTLISEVSDLYAELNTVPEEYSECKQEIKDLYAAFTTVTNFALNTEGSYTVASETASNNKQAFEQQYTSFELEVPELIEIEGVEPAYDFRCVRFGMPMVDVVKSESDNYGLVQDEDYSPLRYNDVDLKGINCTIVYWPDFATELLEKIIISFDTADPDKAVELLKSIYGDTYSDTDRTINATETHCAIQVKINWTKEDAEEPFTRIELTKMDSSDLISESETEAEVQE